MRYRPFLLAALLGACGQPQRTAVVTPADYGETWPISATSVELRCVEPQQAPVARVQGVDYALNGVAKQLGYPYLHESPYILKDTLDANLGIVANKDVGVFMDRALALCK